MFAALCDKLFDIDEKLDIVPQLATGYEWSADNKALTIKLRQGVTFHDGEKLDAAAVKYSLERHKTMAGSNRRGELAPRRERRRRRSDDGAPQPVGAVLAAARAARRPRRHDGVAEGGAGRGRQVRREAGVRGAVQVRRARRAGPHRARALRRTTGTRATIHFDRIVYLPIVDSTVRLANLRSGQLDFIERLAPSDVPQLKSDARFKICEDHRDRLPGHHDQRRQERSRAEEPARHAIRACARRSSWRSIATASCRW